jgi:hypothetical protein
MTVTEQAPSTRPYAPPRLPGSQADRGEEELVSRAADLVPRRFGGYQVSLETKVRVAAELARGSAVPWSASPSTTSPPSSEAAGDPGDGRAGRLRTGRRPRVAAVGRPDRLQRPQTSGGTSP